MNIESRNTEQANEIASETTQYTIKIISHYVANKEQKKNENALT